MTFIDLFAGIGGFRIAFQNAGCECVFSSEIDKFARKTYEANHRETPHRDIREIHPRDIPPHDILCAGFPCQPFSRAGKELGFRDTRGTLFFEIQKVLMCHRPKAFMLENVKGLISHDNGRTFRIMQNILEDELGYVVNWKRVDGAQWVPQHRERLFIVGIDPEQVDVKVKWFYHIPIPTVSSVTHHYPTLSSIIQENVEGYTLGKKTWEYLQRHKQLHEEKGNGFGYTLHTFPLGRKEITKTISARYHKDGAEVLIAQKNNRPRRLTIEEAMQLQGFDPETFKFPVSRTQAYKQIGNSVVVPAVEATAKQIVKLLNEKC